MGVYLREKKVSKGRVSLYLDIWHNGARWYEFLDLKISKKHPDDQDKERKRLALEIRSKRENELIVQDHDLVDRGKRKGCFIKWFENYIKAKPFNQHNYTALNHLKSYMGNRPLPFTAVTPLWIKAFTKYLLGKMTNNTARCYLMDMFTGLEDAVIQEIIPINPFRKIPRHERIKQQNVFRKSFTLEDLAHLINTPCKIPGQMKQAFIFACFSGLRWSDLNCLRWSEIVKKTINGQDEYFMYFAQEKTEDIEYLPLSDQAVEIIQEREREALNEEPSEYVFPEIKETNEKRKLRYRVFWSALKKWGKAAGFAESVTPHTARHSFASNVLENSEDGDLWTVSKLLGHKSIQSTQIYAHVRDKKKAAAVKALPKLTVIRSTGKAA